MTGGKYQVLGLMTAAQAGASFTQQAIGVLGPALVARFDLTHEGLGALFTALFLGSTLFTALGGILTDRFGERRMILAAGALMTVALLAAAALPNYAWLVSWMGIFGAGYAASTPAGGRAVLTWFDRDRGFAMGIRQTGVPIGGLCGALLLPLAAAHWGGYRAALLLGAALVAVPSAAVVVLYRSVPDVGAGAPASTRSLLRGMRMLARDRRLIAVTLTCMVLVSVQVALNGFLTVTATSVLHVSAAEAAGAFSLAFVAATFGRLFWGWFSDRWLHGQRLGLLAAVCALAAPACWWIALLRPGQATLLIPAALMIGLTGAGWNGLMAAALAEIGGAERAGSALGLTLTAIFGASALGPLAFGALADRTSLDGAWAMTGVLALLGVVPVLWLQARRRASA